MHSVLEQGTHTTELNERLRMEPGWDDVASGLARVLIGYLVFVVGTVVGVGLVIWSAYALLKADAGGPGRVPNLGAVWVFWIGMGILSVIGTFGYAIVLTGHWSCVHGSPERHGARWWMFFCLTALFAGPALNIGSYIGCCKKGPEFHRGAHSLRQMKFTRTGQTMQLGGAAASLIYTVLFLLYLRAVAKCHNSRRHALLVSFYLVLVSALVAMSIYVGYQVYKDPRQDITALRLALLIAWLATVVFFIFLIASIRTCILRSIALVRSPLAT